MIDDIIVARVIQVLGVVVWIGGVSMVTTVALPAIRRGELGADRWKAFQAIKRRFVWQARVAVLIVGISGVYMVSKLELWDRFTSPLFWWMHAMVSVWLLFAFALFVAEPFVMRWRQGSRSGEVDLTLVRMQRRHWLLLLLSLVTAAGAVAGSQGWSAF